MKISFKVYYSTQSNLFLKQIQNLKLLQNKLAIDYLPNQSFNNLNQIQYIYFYITFRKRNLFFTGCNHLNNRIFIFNLGFEKLRNKKQRYSPYTTQRLTTKIKKFLLQQTNKNLKVYFLGLPKKFKIFFKFFRRARKYFNIYLYRNCRKPHGGCRLKRDKRR